MLSASIFVLGMLVPAFTQAMPGTITKGAPGGPMNVTEKELHCIEDMIDAKDPYERQIDWPKTAPCKDFFFLSRRASPSDFHG